jgi:coatomer subunit beta'
VFFKYILLHILFFNSFAIRESSTRVTIYKNFKEKRAVPLDFSAEGLFGGRLLGVRSSDSLAFYDWDIASLVARIEITPKLIIWAPSGDLVVIAAAEKFFVLEYYHEVVTAHVEQGLPIPEEGILEAFQVIGELTSGVQSGVWAGDCFVYVDAKQCLNYFVGRNDKCELVTVQHLPKPMRLLGYLPKESRLYLADKDFAVVSYHLDIVVMEYQTRVLRGEIDSATELLPKIHEDQRLRIAHFLEKQGYLQQAFQLTGDPDHQFSLALSLNNLDAALDIARRQDKEAQWRKLGDAAMRLWNFDVAKDCLQKAGDYSGLLLLYSAAGDARGIAQLAQTARDTSKNNVAFICYFLLQRLDDCLQLLLDTDRIPEAALFARSYAPSKVSDITRLWRERLQAGNSKTAYLIADPKEYSNLFPDWSWALEVLVYIAAARYPPILHIRLNNAFELKGARGQSQQTCTRNFAKIPCEILSRC